MRSSTLTRCAVVALFAGALACARNQEETGTATIQDTTEVTDTTGQDQNPPGYRGMERDTSMTPQADRQPVDTFLQNQGVDPSADTSGYSGMERPDTTGQQQQTDTTGWQQQQQTDTSGYQQQQQTDTSGYQQQQQTDTTSWQQQTDTSGYQQQQQTDTSGYQQQQQTDTSGYQQQQTDTSGYQQQQTDSVRLPHDSTRMHRDSAGVNTPDTSGTSQ